MQAKVREASPRNDLLAIKIADAGMRVEKTGEYKSKGNGEKRKYFSPLFCELTSCNRFFKLNIRHLKRGGIINERFLESS